MLEHFSPKRLAKKTLALGLAGTTMLGADKILSAQTNANPGVKKEIKKGQEKEIPILDEVPPENVKIVRDIILRSYVDETNPKIQSIDSLIGLDPHTRYIRLNKFEKWNNSFESKSVSRQFMLPDNITGYIKNYLMIDTIPRFASTSTLSPSFNI